MVSPVRFELTTDCLEGSCSVRLSYGEARLIMKHSSKL